jgi:hypothetical protein
MELPHRPIHTHRHAVLTGTILVTATFLVFWILGHYANFAYLNYTFVVASAFLHGQLGLTAGPSWLNELVPMSGLFYTVFPLGAVLVMTPFAVFVTSSGMYPVAFVIGLLAGGTAWTGYLYTRLRPEMSTPKRALLGVWLVGGTWYMTNLVLGGSWQIALGWAVLGELAALYWGVVRARPFLAGLGLAVAAGNRTEVFLLRHYQEHGVSLAGTAARHYRRLISFAVAPAILAVATAAYNFVRFGSVTDFGYARIPGILQEPDYQQGIFSLSAVGANAVQMFTQLWVSVPHWPYLVPTGFGGSILLASPFLLLLIRKPTGDRLRVVLAWTAIVMITAALWLHGNTGGWQYSYRYALSLLPWFLVLFVEYLPARVTWVEAALLSVSVATSGYATYLFMVVLK